MDVEFWLIVGLGTIPACASVGFGVKTVTSFKDLAIKEGIGFAALTAVCALATILIAALIFDALTLH